MGRLQAGRFVGPALGQIEGAIDEGMAAARNVGGENADLAICDLARRTRILPRDAARRFALLQKAGLVDHQHRVIVSEMFDDIIANQVAQFVGIPTVSA